MWWWWCILGMRVTLSRWPTDEASGDYEASDACRGGGRWGKRMQAARRTRVGRLGGAARMYNVRHRRIKFISSQLSLTE
jgi:hypothetical protein